MKKVIQAAAYDVKRLGSSGDASCMLIRQFQFPDVYDETRDGYIMTDHDYILKQEPAHAKQCFREYTHRGECALNEWLKNAFDRDVIRFLRDLLHADPNVTWTGYRVMATVHRGNGFPVWTLELFAKHPATTTKVYTGNHAPNVEPARSSRNGSP